MIREELLEERKDRLEKVYQNKRPDRVPTSFFPDAILTANYAGFTVAEATSNYDVMYKAIVKWFDDFNIDGVDTPPAGVLSFTLGMPILHFPLVRYDATIPPLLLTANTHKILKDRFTKWPGVELHPNAHPQFIGGKFMEVEEYRKLAEDPITFMFEVVVPRAFESLSKLGSLEAYVALVKLGYDVSRFSDVMFRVGFESLRRGWPMFAGGLMVHPLDFIADFLRHITYTLIDLRRHPDEVSRALDAVMKMLSEIFELTTPKPEEAEKLFGTRIVVVGIPLHLNEMLSPKLFEKFYWPYLKQLVSMIRSRNAIPSVFFEGDFTPFIHYLLELPKSSIVAMFEKADLRKVRKILGDHLPIGGGISPALYIYGTKEKVYEEVCKLLNDVKEPGVFIFMGAKTALPLGTKIENIWAAIEAVKKCGRYD